MRDAERVGRYHTELMLKQTELWRRLSSLPFDAQEARKDVQGRQESANWLRQLSTMMNRGEGMVLLLDTAEGEPVGYAFVTESFDPMTFDRMGIIGEIFVEEPWRGRGAGTEAIRAAERWLTERRVSTTQIFVTRTNEDAVKLYQQNGYITYDYRMVKRLFP